MRLDLLFLVIVKEKKTRLISYSNSDRRGDIIYRRSTLDYVFM